jgi:hypothetical protein
MSARRKPLPAIADGPLALPVTSEMPAGHTTVYIYDERHSPHLRPGENALVDTTDRDIVFGELYLIRQSRGPVIWQVYKAPEWVQDPEKHAMLYPLNRPRLLPDGNPDLTGPLHLADGPLPRDHLATKVIGRVVGIFVEEAHR